MRILVLDDMAETRRELLQLVRQVFPGSLLHEATTLCEARQKLHDHEAWNMALVSLHFSDGAGLELIRDIYRQDSRTTIIATTLFDDDTNLLAAIAAGAQGCLLKSEPPDVLLQCLQQVQHGILPMSPRMAQRLLRHFAQEPLPAAKPGQAGIALSPRETDVLGCIGRGFRVSDTARQLGIAESTVTGYIKTLYQKLNISNRAEAALEASRRQLV